MRIGTLARRARLSVDAIRFYEKAGVLPPAARDPSGYRVYDEQALRSLVMVRWARELGFPLEAIAGFVRSDPGAPGLRVEELRRLIADRSAAIEQEITRLRTKQAELAWLAAIDFTGECRLPRALVDGLMEKHEAAESGREPARIARDAGVDRRDRPRNAERRKR